MLEILFVGALGSFLAALLTWGMLTLPGERWQILAALPVCRQTENRWRGINMTWYGLFSASSLLIAVSLVFVLLGAAGVSVLQTLALTCMICGCCLPAARIVARIVENKHYAFTVGGASFVGIIILPWLVVLINSVSERPIPVMLSLSAVSIVYAIGEGVGRLACISFGCCYGRPVDECPRLLRNIFERWNFRFIGSTKKIAYAAGLERHKVVPIQGITAILYVFTGLVSLLLFLCGHVVSALLISLTVTQIWRVLSEFLRADFRGEWKFTPYQMMSLLGIVYVHALVLFWPAEPPTHINLLRGLGTLWNPPLILFLQGLWIAVFIYTGRSAVTGSTLMFHVNKDKI